MVAEHSDFLYCILQAFGVQLLHWYEILTVIFVVFELKVIVAAAEHVENRRDALVCFDVEIRNGLGLPGDNADANKS